MLGESLPKVELTPEKNDTAVSLDPLSFEEAIAALVNVPKREDSQAEACGNTTEAAPESETSNRRNAQRRKPSDASG